QANDFGDLVANGVNHAKGAHRLLKDHRDILAADIADLSARGVQLHQVNAFCARVQDDLAVDNPAIARDNTHDRLRRNALATATFSRNAQGFAGANVKAHTVNSR